MARYGSRRSLKLAFNPSNLVRGGLRYLAGARGSIVIDNWPASAQATIPLSYLHSNEKPYSPCIGKRLAKGRNSKNR